MDPGGPAELVGDVFAEPGLRNVVPEVTDVSRRCRCPKPPCASAAWYTRSKVGDRCVVDLAEIWSRRVTSSHPASGVTMAARRGCRPPYPTTPPLPPASWRRCRRCTTHLPSVGSTARASPARSTVSMTLGRSTPAPASIVGVGRTYPGRISGSIATVVPSFYGLDHGRASVERHYAAGVTGAAAARNDREFELDAAGRRRHSTSASG